MKERFFVLAMFVIVLTVLLLSRAKTASTDVWGYNSILVSSNGNGIYVAVIWVPTCRAGEVALTTLETTKTITFSSPMPLAVNTNYSISFSPSLLTTTFWSARTSNGFTLNLSLGITGTVTYLAVAYD